MTNKAIANLRAILKGSKGHSFAKFLAGIVNHDSLRDYDYSSWGDLVHKLSLKYKKTHDWNSVVSNKGILKNIETLWWMAGIDIPFYEDDDPEDARERGFRYLRNGDSVLRQKTIEIPPLNNWHVGGIAGKLPSFEKGLTTWRNGFGYEWC